MLSEAQGHGLPCVGFADCPGVNELILNGVNGVLAEYRSADSLASCLRRLMDSEELRLEYGQNAKLLMNQYSDDITTRKWENLLVATVENSRKNWLWRFFIKKKKYLKFKCLEHCLGKNLFP